MCTACEAALLVAETYGERESICSLATGDMQMGDDNDQRIADRHGLPLAIVQELRWQLFPWRPELTPGPETIRELEYRSLPRWERAAQ